MVTADGSTPDAASVLALLVAGDRLPVVAALVLGAQTIGDISQRTQLPARDVLRVLARLVSRADLSASRIFENKCGRKTHCATLRVPPLRGCAAGCCTWAEAIEKMRVAPALMGGGAACCCGCSGGPSVSVRGGVSVRCRARQLRECSHGHTRARTSSRLRRWRRTQLMENRESGTLFGFSPVQSEHERPFVRTSQLLPSARRTAPVA